MRIDYPDPADEPDAPRTADRSPPPDDPRPRVGPPPPADPAEREAIHRDYYARVERVHAAAATPDTPDTPAKPDAWSRAAAGFRAEWSEYEERHSDEARPTPQNHLDGSWSCGDARRLTPDQNAEVNRGHARIREIGQRDIVPEMLAIEAADPSRHLAGFDRRIKGEDRLKEKIADQIRGSPGLSPSRALEVIPDVVRFTYQYGESGYATGVRQDIARLQARGFVEVERRNTWASDQYKGINGRWREPQSGQLFEVQFHTQASRDAKELNHKAYERIRSTEEDSEVRELTAFQRHVNSMIPIPPGVADIENYPPGDT